MKRPRHYHLYVSTHVFHLSKCILTKDCAKIITRAEDYLQENLQVQTAYVVRPIRIRRGHPGFEDALVKEKKPERTVDHASRKPVLVVEGVGATRKRRDTKVHATRRVLRRSSSLSGNHEPLSPTLNDVFIEFPQGNANNETLAATLPTEMLSSSPTPIANYAVKRVDNTSSADIPNEKTNFNNEAGVASTEQKEEQPARLVSIPSGKDFRYYEGFQSENAPLDHLHFSRVRSDSSTDISTIDAGSEESFVTSTAATTRNISIETEALVNFMGEILGLKVLEGFLSTFPATKSATADTSSMYGASQGNIAAPVSNLRALQARAPTAKRSADSRDDSEDADEDESRNAKRQRRRSASSDSSKLLLACPYFKMDSVRYSERNLQEQCYRGCASKLLRNIPRLKQHLYRVHRRPEYYCGRCYITFDTQALADTHSRQSQSCAVLEPQFQEKMDNDQMNAIKRRNRRADAPTEWYSIFKILFPNAVEPASPYTDHGSSEIVQNFTSYFREEAPSIFSELVRGRIFLDELSQEILDETFEQTVSQLVLRFETRLENVDSVPETGEQAIGGNATDSSTSLNRLTPRSEAGDAIENMLELDNAADRDELLFRGSSEALFCPDFFD
jgi:hypothetical protein